MNRHELDELARNMERRERGRSLTNGKPYRDKALKAEARRRAYRTPEGTWRSPVRELFHPASGRRR